MDYYPIGQEHALTAYGLYKLSGDVDHEGLHNFAAGLAPGDVINFSAKGPDVMQSGIRKGLSHLGISEPIRAATGSPEHHTALYAGRNAAGEPMIVHNYEQGNANGIMHEPLTNYANRTGFTAYRPRGATPEQGQMAVDRAPQLGKGTTHYSKRNLVAGSGPAVGQRMGRNVPDWLPGSGAIRKAIDSISRRTPASLISENCDPGSGICSALPHEAWAPALGNEEAIRQMAGKPLTAQRAQTEISPGTIANSPFLKSVGQYAGPKDSPGAGPLGYLRGMARRAVERAGSSGIARKLNPLSRG